jgi:hypothetical protein
MQVRRLVEAEAGIAAAEAEVAELERRAPEAEREAEEAHAAAEALREDLAREKAQVQRSRGCK